MKMHLFSLLLALPVVAAVACSSPDETPDGSETTNDPNQPGGGGNTPVSGGKGANNDVNQGHHGMDETPLNPNQTDVDQKKRDEAAVGVTDVVARLHACGKTSYDMLGEFLTSRGVNLQGDGAGRIWREGRVGLGASNYGARIAEAAFWSSSSQGKLYDMYVLAAAEIRENLTNSTACPGVEVIDAEGKLTRDAISCIIGISATADHVEVANLFVDDDAYADRLNDAIDLGIATLLTSHQLCE